MEVLNQSIAIAAAMLLATSCISDFDPGIESDPVLCMNSVITADSPVFVSLTHTWSYTSKPYDSFDNSFYDALIVDDATVTMVINDTDTFRLGFADDRETGGLNGKGYLSDVSPRPGDKVTLTAVSARYGRAEATVSVPVPPVAGIAEWTASTVGRSLDVSDNGRWLSLSLLFTLDVKVAVTDRASTSDRYMIRWNAYQTEGENGWETEFATGSLNYDAEPLFSEHIGILESVTGSDSYGFTAFTDRQFSGQTRDINLRFDNCSFMGVTGFPAENSPECSLDIVVDCISESYYDYLVYDWQVSDGFIGSLGDIGFADQIFARSNVSTGAGMVVARAPARVSVSLGSYLGAGLEQAESENN